MWQKGVLGDHNPESLVNTMVYMNRLYFALHEWSEHRSLRHKPSQIQLIGEYPYLMYTENVSKSSWWLEGEKDKAQDYLPSC